MLKYLKTCKSDISTVLISELSSRSNLAKDVNRWGEDTLERILSFALAGKMIRGGLVLKTYEMFSRENENSSTGRFDALRSAAAMELIQSGFLIHDDIMDRDQMRRGRDTVYYQYQKYGEEKTGNNNNSRHFGESMGICAGDIAFFLAFDLINASSVNSDIKGRMIALMSREITHVALAQMQDVWAGFSDDMPSEEEIFNLYRHKTARYTFTLPMMLGAELAGTDPENMAKLEKFGDLLGLIFQIKDDEIGIFGEQEKIGKPVGSDIREGKKTLFMMELFSRLKEEDKTHNFEDINWFRDKIESLGVHRDINSRLSRMAEEAEGILNTISLCEDDHRNMLELIQYSLERKA